MGTPTKFKVEIEEKKISIQRNYWVTKLEFELAVDILVLRNKEKRKIMSLDLL